MGSSVTSLEKWGDLVFTVGELEVIRPIESMSLPDAEYLLL